jgi:cytochrome c biogenesis protein
VPKQTAPAAEKKPAGLMNNPLWRFLSSLKLALILMLILIGLSLIGAFIIQVPATYSQDAAHYNYWLENTAQPETGVWYPILHLLGLFNVFHSVWFLGAGALLVISIIVCTFNRWKAVKAALAARAPVTDRAYYDSPDSIQIETSRKRDEVRTRVIGVLKRHRYSLKDSESGGNFFINADKFRFSPLGTYLIHLSLVLFIAGFLIGSYLGFRDSSFTVAEGETREVGNGTGLALKLLSFKDEYWDNGSPKDYTSQVTLLDKGREVKQGAIQVNHPLSYKGIRFYQSFFGATARLEIKDAQGKTLYNGSVLLSQTLDDSPYLRPSGFIQLPPGYTIYVIGRATNIPDADLAENQAGIEIYQGQASRPAAATKLTAGEPYKTSTLEIVYGGSGKYSGFQVSRDPGNSLIWIASALFLAGLAIVFYFPRRRIQVMLLFQPERTGTIYLRPGAERKMGSLSELMKLENAIKKELNQDSAGE